MKRTIFSLIALMWASCLMAEDVLEITSGEYAPFTGKAIPQEGHVSHVIRAAFKLQGVTVKFKYYPWKRSLEMARIGKFVAAAYYLKTQERDEYFYYSKDPVSELRYFFAHLKSNPMETWATLDDLKQYRIGVRLGFAYTPEFSKMVSLGELNSQPVATDLQNFRKLLLGRIDIFPMDAAVAMSRLRQSLSAQERSKIIFHPKPLSLVMGYLLFSKSHPQAQQLKMTFDKGMTQLKKSGKLDEMHAELIAGKYDN